MTWVYPVSAPIGRPYNYAWSGYESGHHTGQDFSAGEGIKVGAASGGRVIYAGDTGGPYGKQIIIDHGNGVYTQYAHLSVVGVKVGDRVKPGMGIGAVGSSGTNSSGPHLHFEVRRNGSSYGDDINPIKFLENHNADRNGVTGDFGGVSAQGDRTGKGDGVKTNESRGNEWGNYGYVSDFLDKHPAIADLIAQARKKGWTPERLSYEIKDTEWWANHSKAQKEWALIVAESPKGEAKAMLDDQADNIDRIAMLSGVALSTKETKDLALKAARNGWDEADIRLAVARKFELEKKSDKPLRGTANDAAEIIDNYAYEYGVPLDRRTREKWIRRTIAGKMDPQSMEDIFREQAKTLYPSIERQLDSGRSVRDMLAPYLQAAASELGVPPDQMDTFKAKWTVPLTGGAKGGPMTLDEWTKTYRTDKRYKYDQTASAKQAAAGIASELGRLMGSTAV